MKLNPMSAPSGQLVAAKDIRIGKDVIEILTSGMYVSPLSIFREYVQNAADAVDEARSSGSAARSGRVAIEIDHVSRSVTIRDDGSGIPSERAVDILLAVGGSRKRGTDARGFRGVGRLSGLAYCRQIEFVTKAKGDGRIVSLAWDCRKLRESVASTAAEDLRSVMASSVSLSVKSAVAADPGFFEVRLRDVLRLRNDILLNEQLIGDYLAQVAPVPFSSDFSFGSSIEQELRKRKVAPPLELVVAGRTLTRPHRDELPAGNSDRPSRIKEIEFFELADVDGEIGGLGWLGHHDYVRSLPIALGVRGLRARAR